MSRERLVAEVAARRDAVVHAIVEAVQQDVTGYAALTEAELDPLTRNVVDQMLAAVTGWRMPSERELRAFREFGATRAGQGVSLEDLLRAWRTGVRVVLDEFDAVGRSHNIADRVVLDVVYHLLAAVDQAVLAFSGGHHEVERDLARRDDRERAEFVRAVLQGTLGPAELGIQLQRHGLDPAARLVAFRVPGTAAELAAAFTTTIDGDLAGFADRAPSIADTPVGVGPPVRPEQLPAAFTRATRALRTATAFGLAGRHELADLGLLPAVLADTEVGDDLVRRYLDPVTGTDLGDLLVETLRVHLEQGQRVERTAAALYVHANTVRYRLARYQELTGHDLRAAGTALELWWALQRSRLAP